MHIPLLDIFTSNPILFALTLLEIPTITNGDFSLFGTVEKVGIIGTLAYLNYQQRNDMKEQQKSFREEENAIINRYEKIITDGNNDYKHSLAEKDRQIFELISKIAKS